RVCARSGRSEDDEVDREGCGTEARESECRDERAVVRVQILPRRDRHDDRERTDIEDEHSYHDGVDGAGEIAVRIFGLRGSRADEFNANDREYAQLKAEQEAARAERA